MQTYVLSLLLVIKFCCGGYCIIRKTLIPVCDFLFA